MAVPEFKREWTLCDMLVVMGPTASGKTAFAVKVARWINSLCKSGEFPFKECHIISADSRQVYRGMDIGTGKDIAEYGEIPYHLIDIAEAGEKYDLFRYKRDFDKVYAELKSNNIFPILCGGSGLYIEAVCKGYDLKEVAPDPDLRKSLEKKPMEELVQMFKDLKAKHGTIPHNNTDFDTKKRVIRAIEIEMAYDKIPQKEETGIHPENVHYIALNPDRERRNQRIDRRLEERLKAGMVDEVKALLDKGVKPEDLIYYGLEYKFLTQYITGEISYDYMKEHLAIAIHRFAKRQMTWLRGMERRGIKIEWIKTD